jgi:hypothetical protein
MCVCCCGGGGVCWDISRWGVCFRLTRQSICVWSFSPPSSLTTILKTHHPPHTHAPTHTSHLGPHTGDHGLPLHVDARNRLRPPKTRSVPLSSSIHLSIFSLSKDGFGPTRTHARTHTHTHNDHTITLRPTRVHSRHSHQPQTTNETETPNKQINKQTNKQTNKHSSAHHTPQLQTTNKQTTNRASLRLHSPGRSFTGVYPPPPGMHVSV